MVPALLVILALAVLYWFPIRRWMSRWGATPSDLSRVMAGDSLLMDWTYSGTMDMRNMGGFDWVWQFGLYTIDEKRTRLVSRSRVRTQTVWARLFTYAIEPAGFLMTRRMLLGIKERAEAPRAGRAETRGDRRAA